ncbi:hypothetical protein TR67_18930 [Pseudomonas deceptionensis]|nr:hypothetical protein TR67_18930 [Pseudomonas deceptionensis]
MVQKRQFRGPWFLKGQMLRQRSFKKHYKGILLLAVKILFHYLLFRDMLIAFLRGMSLLQLRWLAM